MERQILMRPLLSQTSICGIIKKFQILDVFRTSGSVKIPIDEDRQNKEITVCVAVEADKLKTKLLGNGSMRLNGSKSQKHRKRKNCFESFEKITIVMKVQKANGILRNYDEKTK